MICKPALRRSLHSLATKASEIPAFESTNSRNFDHCLRLLSCCNCFKPLIQIHGQLIVSGYGKHNLTLTRLINSYALFQKCDLARRVFDSTPDPGSVPWNRMIRAYNSSQHYRQALITYHSMLDRGLEPDKYTFTFVLKACTGAMDLEEGVQLHREIARKGLESDLFIGTGLMDMYCKLGDIKCAGEVFDKLPKRDVAAWNTMIAGFSQSSNPQEALGFFRSMQMDGCVQPSSVSLLNLFPAVCKLSDIKTCRSIHGYVCRRDFSNAVQNGLVDMYSKCGRADVARLVFNGMRKWDDISWGSMMAGYAHNGDFDEVLELFYQMERENLKMNGVCAVSALTAAAEIRDLEAGKDVHDCVIKHGLASNVLVATSTMTMYAKCGERHKAKQLFDVVEGKDSVAWCALMAAYAQSRFPEEALCLFRDMQNENLKPDIVTLKSVIPACAALSCLRAGKSLHCFAVKNDIESDVSVGTSLVSMYAKCGIFTSALIIFNRMPCVEVVTWNALINGFSQNGDAYYTMDMYHKLRQSQDVRPDSGTMVGVLRSCAISQDLDQGKSVHGLIMKSGMGSDGHINNALIDMYGKCGCFSSAQFLFKKTEFTKDEVSWNAMITGYMHHARAEDALSTFHQMKLENLRPNLVTLKSILPAAASLAALREGMSIHAYIVNTGYKSNTHVGNSLIDMYAKCGCLDYSNKVFNEMNNKDTVSWNALLSGYAVHGCGDHAIHIFSLMQDHNVEADFVSFVNILSACRHTGLVEDAKKIFHSMHEKHHLEPGLEHYACMVDLLGRAGLFDEALSFIEKMPFEPDAGVWGALLGACRMHSNVELGEVASNNLTKLEPGNPAHYVVLSNIYAQTRRWGDARSTRSKMNEIGLKKIPGCSWG